MLTPKQIKIFEAFLMRPYKEITYKEIKDYSKEKSNSVIQKAITKFLLEELVIKRKVGNIILYSLNLENSMSLAYFDILINQRLTKSVKICIKNIKKEIDGINFMSIVIFGSYAQGKQTEKSDLDVALFVNSEDDKRNCKLAMKSAELKSIINLDAHIITKDEMLQMLKEKYENLAKQIIVKHLAIHNPAIFYSMVKEGIDNGFKVIYT